MFGDRANDHSLWAAEWDRVAKPLAAGEHGEGLASSSVMVAVQSSSWSRHFEQSSSAMSANTRFGRVVVVNCSQTRSDPISFAGVANRSRATGAADPDAIAADQGQDWFSSAPTPAGQPDQCGGRSSPG